MAPPVSSQPYFVPHRPGTTVSVRDAGDEGADVEEMPPSVDPDDFAPKLLNFVDESELTPLERFESLHKAEATEGSNRESAESPREGNLQSLTKSLFRKKTQKEIKFSAFDESAKKARPKLFFAGERTFLQWMHTGILLAGISMAIGSHAETGGVADWISVLLLPVAIGIMIYAMFQFSKRTYMIASRSPGPYEDRWGPVVVGVVFGCSLLAQFLVMLAHQS